MILHPHTVLSIRVLLIIWNSPSQQTCLRNRVVEGAASGHRLLSTVAAASARRPSARGAPSSHPPHPRGGGVFGLMTRSVTPRDSFSALLPEQWSAPQAFKMYF